MCLSNKENLDDFAAPTSKRLLTETIIERKG